MGRTVVVVFAPALLLLLLAQGGAGQEGDDATFMHEPPPYARGALLPSCALHLYRHISKAGGTTLRFIFDRQAVLGEWEYPLIYGFKEDEWSDLVQRWRQSADQWLMGKKAAGPRVLVEVRGNWPSQWNAENFLQRVFPQVVQLKQEYGPKGCQITSSLLVRDPLLQTLSFYNYYIKREQNAKQEPNHPKGPAYWGNSLAEWVEDNSDMQVREILGNKCTPVMRQPVYKVQWLRGSPQRQGRRGVPKQCYVRDQDFDRLRSYLDQVDVVGVTSKFDEFLLLLCDKIGMRFPQYIMSNTGSHEKRREALPPDDVAAVDAATLYDRRAFELIRGRQAEMADAAGEDFRRRMEMFQGATEVVGGRKFVGGKGPTPKYKWVANKEIKGRGVKPHSPAFWTEPTGGGQAIAYIFFEAVSMVPREGTQGVPCRKGCNFD